MAGQDESIKKGIERLIRDSCDFIEKPSAEYQKFHKSFLKFSFGALDVEVDYATRTIMVWNSKPTNQYSVDLHNYQESFFEKVSYTDLEDTLMGCMETGVFNERFYKHVLYELDRISSGDNLKTG